MSSESPATAEDTTEPASKRQMTMRYLEDVSVVEEAKELDVDEASLNIGHGMQSRRHKNTGVSKEALSTAITANHSEELDSSQPKAATPSSSLAGISRTVYLGGISPEYTAKEIFDGIRGGAVEALRMVPEKSCAFVDFVTPADALGFWNRIKSRRMIVHGHEIKVGWGKPSPLSETLATAIKNGATRNVYFGGIDETCTEDFVLHELEPFGVVDSVRVVAEKKIAFGHMTCISSAMKAVGALSSEDRWQGRRVNFGLDRCVERGPSAKSSSKAASIDPTSTDPAETNISQENSPSISEKRSKKTVSEPEYRTIYLSGLAPNTTLEDLCNVVRGGILQRGHVMSDKHSAFITFVEAKAAATFFQIACTQGLSVNGKALRVGWSKPTILPGAVINALQQGATRNIYLGNLDLSRFAESKLQADFSAYGEIETINFLREKNVGFVNFSNILHAVEAMKGIQKNSDYATVKISYGKDRCAAVPRMISTPIPFYPIPTTAPYYGGMPPFSMAIRTPHGGQPGYPQLMVPPVSTSTQAPFSMPSHASYPAYGPQSGFPFDPSTSQAYYCPQLSYSHSPLSSSEGHSEASTGFPQVQSPVSYLYSGPNGQPLYSPYMTDPGTSSLPSAMSAISLSVESAPVFSPSSTISSSSPPSGVKRKMDANKHR